MNISGEPLKQFYAYDIIVRKQLPMIHVNQLLTFEQIPLHFSKT